MSHKDKREQIFISRNREVVNLTTVVGTGVANTRPRPAVHVCGARCPMAVVDWSCAQDDGERPVETPPHPEGKRPLLVSLPQESTHSVVKVEQFNGIRRWS